MSHGAPAAPGRPRSGGGGSGNREGRVERGRPRAINPSILASSSQLHHVSQKYLPRRMRNCLPLGLVELRGTPGALVVPDPLAVDEPFVPVLSNASGRFHKSCGFRGRLRHVGDNGFWSQSVIIRPGAG